MGIDMTGLSDQDAVEKVVHEIQELSVRLDIPQKLSEIGIPASMIPELASQAINDICTGGNPRNVTVEDIINIYKEAY